MLESPHKVVMNAVVVFIFEKKILFLKIYTVVNQQINSDQGSALVL